MKRQLLAAGLLLFSSALSAQMSADIEPYSFVNEHLDYSRNLHHIRLNSLSPRDISELEGKDGEMYYISKHRPLYVNLNNAGTWMDVPGGKLWRLEITSQGALALALYYDQFYIPEGAIMHVYNSDRSEVIGAFTSANNKESGIFATGIVHGESSIIEYYEPYAVEGQGVISIEKLTHCFRGIQPLETTAERGGSDPCQVDVRCPEGTPWAPQIDATVRILVSGSSGSGWCTGTVMNNTNVDCTPYVLTAWHCAETSTTSDLNSFIFYFRRQRNSCGAGAVESTASLTGCTMRSHSGNSTTTLGSDYLLVELSSGIPANYQAYYSGWNKSATAPANGVCTHHPSGDVKKISTYCNTPNSTSWPGSPSGSHWNVKWCATVTNHGVTEGGSSGTPLWDPNGRHVGQLTGGGSFCTSPNSSDQYGKMSFNWSSNTVVSGGHLKAWLDPGNILTGDTFDGTYWPCINSVEETVLTSKTFIYPNPSTGIFNIQLHQPLDQLNVSVYNAMGSLVKEINMNGLMNSSVDLSGFSSGIYYLRMQSGTVVVTKKVNMVH